ncbi:uncharacterized protein [Phyllobates terribilis]|uniref:uncharacterized protein n=1 Tax=Phyllobates terribilis TaxID=111132 RepID=UPI003CCACF7C
MYPIELATLNSMEFETSSDFPSNFILVQNGIPSNYLNGFLNNLPSSPTFPYGQEFASQPSGLSNNSTSDEAEEMRIEVVDERKRRRMISNRESARRSRMRKQRQIDELWSQVVRLRTENNDLVQKVKITSECNVKVLTENAQLKAETDALREMITSMHFDSPLNDV